MDTKLAGAYRELRTEQESEISDRPQQSVNVENLGKLREQEKLQSSSFLSSSPSFHFGPGFDRFRRFPNRSDSRFVARFFETWRNPLGQYIPTIKKTGSRIMASLWADI